MPRVVFVQPLAGYQLVVRFEDGTEGVVEMRDRLFGPAFEPLQDTAMYEQVFIDEFGAVAWPNGADLAPDALYERIRSTVEIA